MIGISSNTNQFNLPAVSYCDTKTGAESDKFISQTAVGVKIKSMIIKIYKISPRDTN